MTTNPVSHSLSLRIASSREEGGLPNHLKDWWMEKPLLHVASALLREGSSSAPSSGGVLSGGVIDMGLTDIGDQSKCDAFCRFVRTNWDRASLVVLPKLATPSIILGIIILIVGIGGCTTTISGWDLPGLSFIIKNIPLSIAFSLTLVRAGTHMINNGVMASRLKNRYHQEVQQNFRLLSIEAAVKGLDETRLKEVIRLNDRLPKDMRLDKLLGSGGFYAKPCGDLPSGYQKGLEYRWNIHSALKKVNTDELQELLNELPELHRAVSAEPSLAPERTLSDKWYDWWYARLPALGVFDIVVGQVMLFTALAGIVLLVSPGLATPAFEVFAKDPYLSVIFTFLLLGNWISCTRTGWRMLSYDKREIKRAKIEEDVQRIDIGLARQKAYELHQWLLPRLLEIRAKADAREHEALDGLIAELTKNYDAFTDGLAPPSVLKPKEKGCVTKYLDGLGKKGIKYFATPSILAGILITLCGTVCLGMGVTQNVPWFFAFLTANTPLSILFASGLMIIGIDTIHRGASLSEFGKKEIWKKASMERREECINRLFADKPELQYPKKSPYVGPTLRTIAANTVVEVVVERKGEDRPVSQMMEKIQANFDSKGWYGFWLKSLKVMWAPNSVLSAFLVTTSLAGLVMACGVPAHSFFDFISKDPSFSGTFCLSLLGVGIDAINGSWRIGTYHRRKKADFNDLTIIDACYKKVLQNDAVV